MPLSAHEIAKHLRGDIEGDKCFMLTPVPDVDEIEKSGAASVDLRLGTWFITTKASRHALLDVYKEQDTAEEGKIAIRAGVSRDVVSRVLNEAGSRQIKSPSEKSLCTNHYVPLGDYFILHPHSFVLAATLEWLRLPSDLCGFVTGKSSWGRRGLIIETAPGVHPGFAGCLTLELANVGEIPIKLITGTKICQLFLHNMNGENNQIDQSDFLGQRQPRLGRVRPDAFVRRLMEQRP